jgi:hypothetical protein
MDEKKERKYKKLIKKFRDKRNLDDYPSQGLYAYEIKKLNKSTTLEYVKYWFEIYFNYWEYIKSKARKSAFLKDKQTLLLLRNRPKSEHKDIFDLINKLEKNQKNKESKARSLGYSSTSSDPSSDSNFFESSSIYMFLMVPAIGFPFLIWFSSFKMWVISMIFAFGLAYLNFQLEKNTEIKELKDDGNPLWLATIAFAAVIYWSAFITDANTFCSKQYYTSFNSTVVYESGRYGVKDKMSVRQGSGSSCNPGTVTPWMFFGFLFTALWFFIKTIILFIGYFFRKDK